MDGESSEEHLTFGELDARARAIAAGLQDRRLGGKTVMLLLPPGLDYVAALFGCFYAGAIAVPAYPPNPSDPLRSLERLGTIAADAGARFALTTRTIRESTESIVTSQDALRALRLLVTDEMETPDAWRPEGSFSRTALLQYTSGSTSDPKGVMISHENLMANAGFIVNSYDLREGTLGVIWLPPYHDMGLMGGILVPVLHGLPCVLMSPQSFTQNPLRWLRAVSRHRATISGGPNFAYESVIRAYRRRPCPLDLSGWRVAFNGAETIRQETLTSFAETFADSGFRRSAFVTSYGLAEATLLVTSSAPGESPPTLDVEREDLERGRIQTQPSSGARKLVSSGRSAKGCRVRIVDPQKGTRLPDDHVGEIWVSGPGVAAGYYKQPAASGHVFGARLPGERSKFLKTGDLGFLHGSELYVTGRSKDLIIINGRSLHPQDLERTAEHAHRGARSGGSAAFSIEDPTGDERVVLLQEVARREEAEEVATAIRHSLLVEHGISPFQIVIVPRRAVPKTPSGKVRRQASKELWREGRVGILHVDARASTTSPPSTIVMASGEILEKVRLEVAGVLSGAVSADHIRAEQRLSEFVFDSLALVSLKSGLERLSGGELPLSLLLDDPTIGALSERVAKMGSDLSPAVAVTPAPIASPPTTAKPESRRPSPPRTEPPGRPEEPARPGGGLRFSLMFFSSYGGQRDKTDKYRLVLDAARFADRAGFEAIWIPERHFHPFGGLFPNPAVIASAVAAETRRIRIRAGSVVLPLHDPIRIAEDWAVVDNLSGGRVDLSFATGWDANSFVLAPDRYEGRFARIADQVTEFRRLWRGDPVRRRNGAGGEVEISIYPKPRQVEPELWLTAAQDPAAFELAGAAGYNILTALLFQSMETLSEKVVRYRKARAGVGLDPNAGKVTVMLHTFIGSDLDAVRGLVKEPFVRYLESSVHLWGHESEALSRLSDTARADVLALAFERYFQSAGLIGTVESTSRMAAGLRAIGVDEIACLIDFGVEDARVLDHLPHLDQLRRRFVEEPARALATETQGLAPRSPASDVRPPRSPGPSDSLDEIDLDGRHDLSALETSDVFGRAELFHLPDRLREADLLPFYLEFTDMGPATARVGGRPVIMMGGLDYLGLSADPRVRDAAARAALATGTSRTGSRLHCGSTPEQRAFEKLIADFLGREDAIVFASGYMAQSGLITALLDPDSVLLLDERAHASIVDGGLIARSRIRRFSHNDLGSLEQQLRRDAGAAILVMIESLYSNEGDLAPLPEIRQLCDVYKARLAVDEAHGLGVLGEKGLGIEEHFGMPGSIDVLTGTFSKSLASVGGWIAGSRKVMEWIRYHGRSILFSAAISPAALAAAQASLEILITEPDRVERLRGNSRRWRDLLVENGLALVTEPKGPLVSVRIGDERDCLLFSKGLLDAGVYANTVLHPSVRRGEAVIRTVVTAAHQEADLVLAARAFAKVRRDLATSAFGLNRGEESQLVGTR